MKICEIFKNDNNTVMKNRTWRFRIVKKYFKKHKECKINVDWKKVDRLLYLYKNGEQKDMKEFYTIEKFTEIPILYVLDKLKIREK